MNTPGPGAFAKTLFSRVLLWVVVDDAGEAADVVEGDDDDEDDSVDLGQGNVVIDDA